MTKHFLQCEAPICQDDNTKSIVWYPGEKICLKKPLMWFQKKQININNLLKIGKISNITPKTRQTLEIGEINSL